jgi:hypothetical protein
MTRATCFAAIALLLSAAAAPSNAQTVGYADALGRLFANQPVSLSAGLRCYLDSPDSGPHGLGGRVVATFLFPTG